MAVNPYQSWFDVDGDNTLALDWDLNRNSHVWEIGGFEGRWAQQMWDKFHCNITIFEPQLWAVERMKRRFDGIEKIKIKRYGLMVPMVGSEWDTKPVGGYETDGASIYSDREPVKALSFRSIRHEFFDLRNLVDVALMNIEGMEYDLIPYLCSSLSISVFENFWCQFHPKVVDDRDLEAEKIFKMMEQTHDMLWNHFPTAVAWKRKEGAPS